jgi:hypothetical protein
MKAEGPNLRMFFVYDRTTSPSAIVFCCESTRQHKFSLQKLLHRIQMAPLWRAPTQDRIAILDRIQSSHELRSQWNLPIQNQSSFWILLHHHSDRLRWFMLVHHKLKVGVMIRANIIAVFFISQPEGVSEWGCAIALDPLFCVP